MSKSLLSARWIHVALSIVCLPCLLVVLIFILEASATRTQVEIGINGSDDTSVDGIAWSHDSKRLAIVGPYGPVRLLDSTTGRQLWINDPDIYDPKSNAILDPAELSARDEALTTHRT